MSKPAIRVIIPTTHGPAEICFLERLSQRAGRSMATISRQTATNCGSRVACLDHSYDRFVRGAEGIVERLTGYGFFRMEIDKNISAGSSWQLATFIAHALESRERLAQRRSVSDEHNNSDDVQTLIWATGRVNAVDHSVGDVGHVARKIATSLAMLCEYRSRGKNCLVFLPADNMGEIDPADLKTLTDNEIPIIAVSDCNQALQHLGIEMEPAFATAGRAPWTGNPYPGLQAFTPELRDIFYGRSRAREETLEQLRNGAERGKPLLLIHGRSGVGKSSLAMAGLAGDVVAGAHEGGRWTVSTVRFGSSELSPGYVLARSIASSLMLKGESEEEFVDHFASEPAEAVRRLLDTRSTYLDKASLLLVLDQFEQAFSIYEGGDTAESLGMLLDELSSSGRVWIIATMRTDQLEILDMAPVLSRLFTDDRTYRLSAPILYELRDIIIRPARAAGYELATDNTGEPLADYLAELAMQSPDSLPILQFLLHRMAESAGPDKRLDMAILRKTGGLEGALEHRAEDAVSASGQPDSIIDRALSGLIRTDISGRGIVGQSIRLTGATAEDIVHRSLLDAHLLVSEVIDGITHARVAHEKLITGWPRLNRIATGKFGAIRLRDQLHNAALQWMSQAFDPDLLLRGNERIVQAEDILNDASFTTEDHVRAFVTSSRKRHEDELAAAAIALQEKQEVAARQFKLGRSLWRRTVAGAAVAAALTAVSAGLAVWAYAEFRRAASSEAIGLARLASDRAELKPLDSISLALAALATDPHTSGQSETALMARQALARAMSGGRTMAILQGHEERINSAAVSDDGTLALTGSDDATAILWDVATGTVVRRFSQKERTGAVAFRPDGRGIVAVSRQGHVRIWNDIRAEMPERELRITASGTETFSRLVALEERVAVTLGLSDIADLEKMTEEQYLAARKALATHGASAAIETVPEGIIDEAHIKEVKLSRYGRYAIVENLRGDTVVWDLNAGTRIFDLRGGSGQEPYRFSRNGRFVVSATQRHALPEPDGAMVPALIEMLGSDPTGRFTKTYGQAGWTETQSAYVADIVDAMTVHVRQRSPGLDEFSLLDLPESIQGHALLALSPDNSHGLLADVDRQGLSIIHPGSGATRLTTEFTASDLLDAPQFSSDGTRLVILSRDASGAVHLVAFESSATESWREVARSSLPTAKGTQRHGWMLADGGKYVLATGYAEDKPDGASGAPKGYGIVFSAESPQEILHGFETDPGAGDSRIVGISRDGRMAALAGSYRGIRLFDVTGAETDAYTPVATLNSHAHRVRFMAHPPVAITEDDTVSLHDIPSGVVLGNAYHPAGTSDVLISQPGSEIAFLRPEGSAVLWRPELLSRPLEQLACDYLPVIDGKPYWTSGINDPYRSLKAVAGMCGDKD